MVVRMIDEFPIFAVAAAYARGATLVRDAAELRYKESDRIGKLCGELQKLGIDIRETDDGFIIHGNGEVKGGEVRSYGDHRLAMSLMVAGLGAHGHVSVEGAEMAGESFPDFMRIIKALGANMKEEG
jgi:3-phosphoshikimate 1-carboxyvinyltransferase